MPGTLNPASPAFTLKERARTRRDGGVQIVDTYAGPASTLGTFLAAYVGQNTPPAHPSHPGSILDEIRERYDDSRAIVYVDLTYVPASAGYSYTPLRPVGSVVIEAEPVTEDLSLAQWTALGGSGSDFADGQDSIAKPAVQVSVIETVRNYNWSEAELSRLAVGQAKPPGYSQITGTLTDNAWSAAGCRVREGDGVAEITRIWMFRPWRAPTPPAE